MGLTGVGSMLVPGLVREASACGGMFCDAGPTQMPVDQTGETIVFVLDGDHVEAHIQIEYDGGDASKFAWMVPVFGVPEVEVGSFQFIQNVLDGTVPTYGMQSTTVCEDSGGNSSDTGIGFISDPDGGGASVDPGPEILLQDTAGAFDYVVLQDDSSDVIMQWLADNGYADNVEAPAIVQTYVDEGAVFVAFKLAHDEGIEDIHPVVLRYEGMEPCIPLRLTRIAAKDDMDVRALFVGEQRVMSTNYKNVLLNRTRLDWLQLGANYPELVSMAVDEAGGRAWVAEYAGTTAVVPRIGLDAAVVDAEVFETMAAVDVVDALRAQGLMTCSDTCVYDNALLPSLLAKYLPAPPDLAAEKFYACLSCYEILIDTEAWDPLAFAADFRERIAEPIIHAAEVLETWPYLTRLYTRISPHEMLFDPFFAEVSGLANVPNLLGALRTFGCCDTTVRLPGGREVTLESGSWPSWGAEMPWAERIEEYQPFGAPATIVNNTARIDDLLDRHNAAVSCEPGAGTGGEAPPGDDDDHDDDPETGGTSYGSAAGGQEDELADVGCACAAGDRGGPLGWASLFVGAWLGWARRRR